MCIGNEIFLSQRPAPFFTELLLPFKSRRSVCSFHFTPLFPKSRCAFKFVRLWRWFMRYISDPLVFDFIHCTTFSVVLRFESLVCCHFQLNVSSGQSLRCSVTGNRSFWGVQRIRCFPLPERADFRNVVLLRKMTENVQRKKIPLVIRCTSMDRIFILDCTAISGCSAAVCYTAVCDVYASLSPPYAGLELQWSQTPDEEFLSFLCLCYPF